MLYQHKITTAVMAKRDGQAVKALACKTKGPRIETMWGQVFSNKYESSVHHKNYRTILKQTGKVSNLSFCEHFNQLVHRTHDHLFEHRGLNSVSPADQPF